MTGGTLVALLAMGCGVLSVAMGFGSSIAATSTVPGGRVFDHMLIQVVLCASGLVTGLVMLVVGLVLWRRKNSAAAAAR